MSCTCKPQDDEVPKGSIRLPTDRAWRWTCEHGREWIRMDPRWNRIHTFEELKAMRDEARHQAALVEVDRLASEMKIPPPPEGLLERVMRRARGECVRCGTPLAPHVPRAQGMCPSCVMYVAAEQLP